MARVRLVDVAERAGVSMKTVSNVVNHVPTVAPALREKVQAALDELGYRPNITARRLVTGKTGTIALAIPELDHPYFSQLARHIADQAAGTGYRLLIEQTLGDGEAERAVLAEREAGLVDGVIFHPVRMSADELGRLPQDTPVVLIGESAAPPSVDLVLIDNVLAAQRATEHLVALGRTRIAFLGTVQEDPTGSTARRIEGYHRALREAGVQTPPGLVLPVHDFSAEAAEDAVSVALRAGAEFDALLCRDDRFALGALTALRNSGRRVPDDVAVVGWDDTAVASYTNPALTSVAPDKAELARVALELLGERIGGFEGPGRHRVVGHRVEIRESAPRAP